MDSWGQYAIALRLPAVPIRFQGLSATQYHSIAGDYGDFVSEAASGNRVGDLLCRAGRLPPGDELPSLESLCPERRYTPRTVRDGDALEITGYNFRARMSAWDTSSPIGTLCVAEQAELANPLVVENFLRILVAHRLLKQGGVLLHSVGALYGGRAYLFSGLSGSGKTTLAYKAVAAGAEVLSDDINLVVPEDGEYKAEKVPFTGTFGRHGGGASRRGRIPLGGIALLAQTQELTVSRLRPASAVAGLLTGCPFVNTDANEFPVLLDVLADIAARVPIIRVGVARDDTFERVMKTMLTRLEYA